MPLGELPALSDEQREVARKLGVSEEDYARSALAGQRTQQALLQKAEALASFLDRLIQRGHEAISVTRVVLDVVEHRFIVELNVNGRPRIIRVDEGIVDDYFDSGSTEAEANLARIFDRALLSVTA
ncbi:MAG: hypothetical protein ABSD98_17495 [Candidatus Korobacteraceae bacterium]